MLTFAMPRTATTPTAAASSVCNIIVNNSNLPYGTTATYFHNTDLIANNNQIRFFASKKKKNKKAGKKKKSKSSSNSGASPSAKASDTTEGLSANSNDGDETTASTTAAATNDASSSPPPHVEKASVQHEAWVKFQQDIAVDGFETGQVLKARVVKKTSSGHKLRPLKAAEVAAMRKQFERPPLADVRSGTLPALRYSDEETERLLKMAYEALPKRDGKRGTRNLKRQKRRWFLVRKIHAKQKRFKVREHYSKMSKRSLKVQQVRDILQQAPTRIEEDRQYQEENFQRWLRTMSQVEEEEEEEEESHDDDDDDEDGDNDGNDNNDDSKKKVQQLES